MGGHVSPRDVCSLLLPLLQLLAGHVGVVVLGAGQAVLGGPVLLRVASPSLPPAGAGAVPHAWGHVSALWLDDPGVGVNIGQDWKYSVTTAGWLVGGW